MIMSSANKYSFIFFLLKLYAYFPCIIFSHFKFYLNLMGWHWLIKLYRFQVYSFIIHHVCFIVRSPPQIMSFSFTIYFPYTFSYLPPPPFPSGNHHTVVCVWEGLFFCLIPSPFSPRPTTHPCDSCQSILCIYDSVSILFLFDCTV